MAAIICKKHGRQYCVFCAPSLAARIRSGEPPDRELFVLKLELMGEPGVFWVDDEFLRERGINIDLQAGLAHVADEEWAFDLFATLAPVCVRCYEEYLAQHGLGRPEQSIGTP